MTTPLIILTGPTAVGKTDLSLQLAKAVDAEIVSADSMQIYKYMDIGSAKVTEEEISKTLDIFYHRFRTQQFKRSCIPDGPKVGSVALSPRGDLRLPSDLMKMY